MSSAYGNCDFSTGQYIQKLQKPEHITKLVINVPKSSKYAKNAIKIFTSETDNIPPSLKRRFKAKLIVNYSFGTCVFEAIIRQNGDWKDHIIILKGGNAVRSIDVKLQTGNVLSTTHFKLLIPNTRNSANEVLATEILKRLGFISPTTFAVTAEVNGTSSPMLFQEASSKELVEKNLRRESALFEGDEELLWSYPGYNNGVLEPLALSRVTNRKWFKKGRSSQAITLSSFSRLQLAYLKYSLGTRDINSGLIILPNENKTPLFSEYMFALLAMNGSHALRPHNRKYFFNSITSNFEPIYYDGNASFSELATVQSGSPLETILSQGFSSKVNPKFTRKINQVLSSPDLRESFLKRAQALDEKAQDFYDKRITRRVDIQEFYDNSINIYKNNVQKLIRRIEEITGKSNPDLLVEMGDATASKYFKIQKEDFGLEQKVITNFEYSGGRYMAKFQSGEQKILAAKAVSNVVSQNKLDGIRTVFLGELPNQNHTVTSAANLPISLGEITTSSGMNLTVSQGKREITFIQSNQDDWALLKSGDFTNWKIKFAGKQEINSSRLLTDQRFNEYGLTGCITLYNSILQDTTIEALGGVCEDSVNIISSKGSLESVSIAGAFADALDIDFSTLEINTTRITDAGNDCVDVSKGKYKFGKLILADCSDKGISVGEASKFIAERLYLNRAEIGVSSKDYSTALIFDAKIKNAAICAEAFQKKQEFGGAMLKITEMNCEGIITVDENSVYEGPMP